MYTEKEIKFLKTLKSQWVSQEDAFSRLSAVKWTDNQTLEDTSRTSTFQDNAPDQYQAIQDYKTTPIGQMGQGIQSWLKGLYGDIKSNLTGEQQAPWTEGILNRTVNRFGQAWQDIGEALKGANPQEFAQQMVPWQQFTPNETEKKLATAISKPFTGTAGDIITSGAKTLMTDERQQEVKDLLQSEPVRNTLDKAKQYFEKAVPNPTDRAFLMEAINYVPVPVLDDMLAWASKGLEFEAGQSLKEWLKTGAGNVVGAIKTPEVVKQGASNLSDRILTNANRMTKGDINKFQNMTGETPWEFLNNRGITQTGEDLFDTLRANAQKSVQNADEAVSLVEGNYKMPETMTSKWPVDYVETMLKDNLEKAEKTWDASGSLRNAELLRKYQEGGLTLKDITEGQRYMQKNNQFTYVDKWSDRAQLVTNIDSQVRKWKFDVAEENGFTNWKAVNKETQAYNNLLEKMTGWAKGVEGNNPISLTDWLAFSADPKVYLAKQLMDSAWFKEMMVRGLNKVAQREWKLPLAELDKEAIIREQVKKRYGLDNSGRTPTVEGASRAEVKALPSGEWKTSSANVVDVKPIEVWPRWSNPPDITNRSIIRDPRVIIEGLTPPSQIAKIKLERALMNINSVPDGVEKAIAEIAWMVADGKLTPDDILSIEETLRKAGLYLDENGNVLPITENTAPTPKEEAKIESKKKLKPKTEKKVKAKTTETTEVLSTPETVKDLPEVTQTQQADRKTGSELFKKNTDIDVNDSIKLVYKWTTDRTLGKMNDYTIYKDGNNVGTTDIVDRWDHYTIGNIELKDYAQRKGIWSDIHKFVIEKFDKPFRTDPSLSEKMVWMLDKLKNEGYLTVKEMPRKNWKGTFTVYESNSKQKSSLPLSSKSEVKGIQFSDSAPDVKLNKENATFSLWKDVEVETKITPKISPETPKTPQVEGKTAIGKYKSSEILPTDNPEFSQRFIPESKIDEKTTKMATIQILDKNGKVVEDFAFSRRPYSEKEIQDMADTLIRERVLGKAFNSKEFDTKLKGLKNIDVNKPKPPLPLSQKTDVIYSKPDNLIQEARKYNSAEEFVKAQETLYHWTQAVKAKDYTAIESKMKEIYKKLWHEYKESDSVKIVGNAEELVAKRSNEKLSKVQSEIDDLQELLSRKISKPSSKFAGSSNKDVRDNLLGSFLTPDRDFAGRFTYDISYDLAGRKTIQQKNWYLVENYFKWNTLDLSKASDYDLDFLAKTLNMPKKDIVAELKTKGGTKEIQKKLAPKKDIISKEYDAVSNYAYDSEAKKWKKEIAVMNDESLYTKQQLIDIYNKANKK